jgi:hypothetical protein
MSGKTRWIAKTVGVCAIYWASGAALPLRPFPGPAAATKVAYAVQTLEARMQAFLEAVSRHDRREIANYFPRSGEFTYFHTVHEPNGSRAAEHRFQGREAANLIESGPLWTSFDVQVEDQPIGLFAHQVMLRGAAWKRVSETRFVPNDADAASAIFVEWRRERSRWVVSSFGDERFTADPLPSWCC